MTLASSRSVSTLWDVLERFDHPSGVRIYISPLLRAAGVPHAFSTRIGGASKAPFHSLNLGNPAGTAVQDPSDNVHENYRRLQAAIGCEKRQRAWVHQVHGGEVARCDGAFESGRKADALVGDDPDRLLAVRVADCVPILLSTRDGRCVAAVHAGWRGIIAGVLPTTARAMQVDPARELLAAIGPCISAEEFEVGPEVLVEFRRVFGDAAPLSESRNGKGRVDLREAARRQLLALGVPEDHVDTTDRCTVRDADEFYSHRRERGITGRMAAVIGCVR
jgi:YfiH family protein